MKFLPTLDVWNNTVQKAILSGQIKLQRGQWLRCGTTGKRCRYVSHTKDSLNVVHWQGTSKATNDLFNRRIEVLKQAEKRKQEIKNNSSKV